METHDTNPVPAKAPRGAAKKQAAKKAGAKMGAKAKASKGRASKVKGVASKTVALGAQKPEARTRKSYSSGARKHIPPVVTRLNEKGENIGGRPNDVWPESRVEAEALAMLAILEGEIGLDEDRKALAKEELAHRRGYSWAAFNEARKHFPHNATIGEAYARIGEIIMISWIRKGATGRAHFAFCKFILSANHGLRESQAVEHSGSVDAAFDDHDLRRIAEHVIAANPGSDGDA